MKFVVKLFPEITIKSKPVRQRLVKQLRQNVKEVLRREVETIKVVGFWDKVEVRLPEVEDANENAENLKRVSDALQRIPGIANILRVQSYEMEDIDERFEDILEKVHQVWGAALEGQRFVVRVKRVGEHRFQSHELERYLGGGLLRRVDGASVDLKNPDITVNLEVRQQTVYIVEQRYEGLGGYPIGTQEPVLSLISGGFDSTVSSYLTMKRGLKTHFCFFNLGGSAHEIGVKQVALYLWERYGISHRVKFISIPFEGVVGEILKSVHHSQMGVVLKRMMLRAATRVADEMKFAALVTGESVAQVSSQTLPNLKVIDEVSDALILRPLVTMDKLDIIRLSAQIGTEEFAKNMPEYCGVISDRPTTNAKLDRIRDEEAGFDFSVLEEAIVQRDTIKIDQVLQTRHTVADVSVVSLPDIQDCVVDIRHPDEVDKKPLELTSNPVINIPFYELMGRLDELDRSTAYLLYCEKGSMSQLHASHLKSMGLQVGVFKPA